MVSRLVLVSLFVGSSLGAIASTNKHDYDSGYRPVSASYYDTNSTLSRKNDKGDDRLQRYGSLPGYGPSGGGGVSSGGYPHSGVGIGINPLKIDLGGVVLGTLIGLGAVLILPKLAHIFASGGYRRSEDSPLDSAMGMLAKFEQILDQNNIDSSVCMQRAICLYVRDAQKNIDSGEGSSTDQIISTLSGNSLVTNLLDGTSLKQAIEEGRTGDPASCSFLQAKCPINKDTISKIISGVLPM